MVVKIFPGSDELLEEALKVRFEVFVIEQKVPQELERDEVDPQATHVLLHDNGVGFATGRIYADKSDSKICRIGRVAVLRKFRGQDWGRTICNILIQHAEQQGFGKILIHAQTRVEKFYARLGFTRIGKEFYEAGIEHVEMEKSLKK
jgi:predicted GNAT family N-acyltransferase